MAATPKQTKKASKYKQSDWYSYYAGYSDEFVYEYLKEFRQQDFIVLDPWNGAGTTSLCCYFLNINCIGIDINPVMNIIAAAKLFQPSMKFIEKLEKSLISECKSLHSLKDPLLCWFTDDTVSIIRDIEKNICAAFNIKRNKDDSSIDISSLTNETAYIILLLFLSIREYGTSFVSSNPTWIKAKNVTKVSISKESWVNSIRKHALLTLNNCTLSKTVTMPQLIVGDSMNIPLPDKSVNIVMTSPPYCTRIDYAIYTQLELAIIGIQQTDVKNLRNHMIGSPTVHRDILKLNVPPNLKQCNQVLETIKTHTSKAAQSYYFKTYKQYILEMYFSLKEIDRVLKDDGQAILVVQDSWFKDIHVDVPLLVLELAEQFHLKGTIHYNTVKQNMVNINTKSRAYKKDKSSAEAIIKIRKE